MAQVGSLSAISVLVQCLTFIKIVGWSFRDCPVTVCPSNCRSCPLWDKRTASILVHFRMDSGVTCLLKLFIISFFSPYLFMFSNLRLKRLFCQSAEDPETRVTSMITKRRMFTSRRRKSARKSLPIFSRHAGLPSGLTCFEETCTLLGGVEVEQRRHTFKTKKILIPSFQQLNEVLLVMFLRAISTNL